MKTTKFELDPSILEDMSLEDLNELYRITIIESMEVADQYRKNGSIIAAEIKRKTPKKEEKPEVKEEKEEKKVHKGLKRRNLSDKL
jgi:hypothetical protein